jgi:hypothetical protein
MGTMCVFKAIRGPMEPVLKEVPPLFANDPRRSIPALNIAKWPLAR